jgi:tetratricopeptide (TPR) repeat protein
MPWTRFEIKPLRFWWMTSREIKDESAASVYSFRYSAAVFSLSILTRASLGLVLLACSACAGAGHKADDRPAPQAFYTVTGEMALARGAPRVAALQYAAAAATETDPVLLKRAADVTAETLQPTLTAAVAARWIHVDPKSLDARRAAARAALTLFKIEESAAHYRFILLNSPAGTDAVFADLEVDLGADDNVFGARQVADRLAALFPASPAALRIQGLTALRADDPAAAVKSLQGAMAIEAGADEAAGQARRDLAQTLARAQIMAGDVDKPLESAQAQLKTDATTANRIDFAVLLMTAQRYERASEQLEILARDPDAKPMALRLMGLLEFEQGHLDVAAAKFRQMLRTGKYQDDGFYYLGVIADRHDDPERALRWYAQVQSGENVVPALLRAAVLLQKNGAPSAADELFDRLIEDEPQRAPEVLTARARMYARSSDVPKAMDVLSNGLLQYPDSVELRYAAASVYEEQGHTKAALRELTQVLKARPNDPAALNALGFTLADHAKQLSRARKLIERAYSAAPRNAAILDSLGWVLYRQGRTAEALPYLTAAFADDHDGDIAAHLGEVLWQLGKPDEAKRIWAEASAFDADNQLLKSTRQRLNPTN